jgi:hypothetical protein
MQEYLIAFAVGGTICALSQLLNCSIDLKQNILYFICCL